MAAASITTVVTRGAGKELPIPVVPVNEDGTAVSGGGAGTEYTEDAASAANPVGRMLIARRRDTPVTNEVSAEGDNIALNATNKGELRVAAGAGTDEIGRVNQIMFNAAGTTLTRPANTTPYTANDSVSDNATAGSVTALTVTVADANDAPVIINEIKLDSTDTGPGTAAARFRVWVYNSDPTASSGVGGGDNAAFSNKRAGFIGTFIGTFLPFSDGSQAICVPEAPVGTAMGGVRICNPVSGAKTLFYQFQALDAFTPSANSTTFIARFKGWQGRLAA